MADEKIGDVDCYVLTGEIKKGITHTLWIGKQDFLIHQSRNVTSAEVLKATMAAAAKNHPEIAASLQRIQELQNSGLQGITANETHRKIVVNPKLTAADFAP